MVQQLSEKENPASGEEKEYRLIKSRCNAEECGDTDVYGIEIESANNRSLLEDISDDKHFVLNIMSKMQLNNADNILEYTEKELVSAGY
jgi:hypothetical protein